jgi:hypothetical protein
LAHHVKFADGPFHSLIKERNTISICTGSVLNVDSLDSSRVFSLFERETTSGLFVGKLNAIYQQVGSYYSGPGTA